ncbi:type II secretion system F family protein [Paenibacillus chartarius]|uniref:Type II secretion system F family protein n=1 Tax=Paenibacillus chartarius TaxID=747481 RepID=A0ABV6DMG0_9BACL
MKRNGWGQLPWPLPWRYVSAARACGWELPHFLYISMLAAAIAGGLSLGSLFHHPWLGLGMAVFAAYAAPGELLEAVRRRNRKKLRNTWIETIRLLHNSYLVCGEWRKAIQLSLSHMPDETRGLFREWFRCEHLGMSLPDMIWEGKKRMPIAELNLFWEAIQLLENVGGPLGETLLEESVAWIEEASARAEDMDREISARLTESRHLFVLFLVELLFLRIVEGTFFSGLFDSAIGQTAMVVLFSMNALCVMWVRLHIRKLENG